jgi:hypothetical protein
MLLDCKALVALLSEKAPVWIQTHDFPDPDAIASAFGLQRFLRYFSIDSILCCRGEIDKLSARRMLSMFDIRFCSQAALAGLTPKMLSLRWDTQACSANRTDFGAASRPVSTITPNRCSGCRYAGADIRPVGACSSIIVQYYLQAGVALEEDAAAALAYGIKMDTAEFSRGATDLDVDMFALAYKRANREKLAALCTNRVELEDLRSYGAAVDSVELCGHTGFACLPFPCPDAMIAIISDFILSIDVVDVAVIHSVRPDGLKFPSAASVRRGRRPSGAKCARGGAAGRAQLYGRRIHTQSNALFMGEDPTGAIKARFLDAIRSMDETAAQQRPDRQRRAANDRECGRKPCSAPVLLASDVKKPFALR